MYNNILKLTILILEVDVSTINKLEIIIKIMYASLKKLFQEVWHESSYYVPPIFECFLIGHDGS